jgi:dihydroorotase-like cyclic amidohydrolase
MEEIWNTFPSKMEKTDTHLNMNESHKHSPARKNPALKGKHRQPGLWHEFRKGTVAGVCSVLSEMY